MRGLWVATVGLLLLAGVRAASGAPGTVVATVGPSTITQDELDRRAAELEESYKHSLGRELTIPQRQAIRRQALETLTRARLYRLEADRLKVQVPDAEVVAYLKKMPIFNPGGVFSPSAWLHAGENNPALFKQAKAEARRDLGATRYSADLVRSLALPDDVLRRAAARDLMSADIDVLLLPRAGFTGGAHEPSERELATEYGAHLKEFERAAEASVRAVALDPIDSDGGDRSRLRSRADSVLTSLRAGMPIAVAADRFRGSLRRMTLRDDNLPGSWRAPEALNARIFRASPGALIDDPVPSATGFYVVAVDSATPRRAASLAEVSQVIRSQLRAETRQRADERQLADLYHDVRDSLSRPGYKVRVALVDAAQLKLVAPSEADLIAYYQSRLADYTRYDAAKQELVTTPLAEIRNELAQGWSSSRRDLFARDLANRISDAWTQGRRDRGLEAQAKIYEPGPVPYGSPIEAGPASDAVSDTLRRRQYDRQIEIVPFGHGYAVAQAFELVERVVPTLEQVRGPLLERLHEQQQLEEIARARTVYERDPEHYLVGKLIYYSRLLVPPPELIDVPLSRNEIDTYYRQHLAEYASPERFRVRHLLVRPSGTDAVADRNAADRARELRARIKAGEDLGELARQFSDDDKTREDYGDLGYRAAGELAPDLQMAAFALRVGQVSEVVHSTDGYHILQLTEHLPEQAEPVAWVYTVVGASAAMEKSLLISRIKADSLAQLIRTPAEGRAIAEKLGLEIEQFRHAPGDRVTAETLKGMAERLERMRPGEIYPGSEFFKGHGSAVMWVDSIAPAHQQSWDEAQTPVLLEYRRRVGREAVSAKQAELDSLLRVGWSFDSLGGLWGGLHHDDHFLRGKSVSILGAQPVVDSLVFGTANHAGVDPGALSGWIDLPPAAARFRVNSRRQATAAETERTVGQYRSVLLEYHMQDALKSMKQRFPVRILDSALRDISLPPLPPMPQL